VRLVLVAFFSHLYYVMIINYILYILMRETMLLPFSATYAPLTVIFCMMEAFNFLQAALKVDSTHVFSQRRGFAQVSVA
jgi:hypothetical protein